MEFQKFKSKSLGEVLNIVDDLGLRNQTGFIDDVDTDSIDPNSGSGDYSGNTYSQAAIDNFNDNVASNLS